VDIYKLKLGKVNSGQILWLVIFILLDIGTLFPYFVFPIANLRPSVPLILVNLTHWNLNQFLPALRDYQLAASSPVAN
jgi:hypothetical protein